MSEEHPEPLPEPSLELHKKAVEITDSIYQGLGEAAIAFDLVDGNVITYEPGGASAEIDESEFIMESMKPRASIVDEAQTLLDQENSS
jgi:hypothetical protein